MRKKVLAVMIAIFIGVCALYVWFNTKIGPASNDSYLKKVSDEITVIENAIDSKTEKTAEGSKEAEAPEDDLEGDEMSENGSTLSPADNLAEEKINDRPKADLQPLSDDELERTIIQKYTSQLVSLKKESLSQLNALISEAKKEYTELSKEKKVASQLSLALEYMKKGKSLEKECDKKFNSIVEAMENELKENNLPVDAVKEAQNQYSSEKSERRKHLLAKMVPGT